MSNGNLLERKSTKLLLFVIFCLMVIYSNSIYLVPNFLIENPLISYELPEFSQDKLNQLGLILPYVLIVILVVAIDFYYLNFITNPKTRRMIKVIMFLLLIFGFMVIYSQYQNIEDPENPGAGETSSTFSSDSLTVNITFISKTLPPSSSKQIDPPKQFSTGDILKIGEQLFNLITGLIPFLLIISVFIFGTFYRLRRNFKFNKKLKTKEDLKEELSLKVISKIRKDIIRQYIEISNYLELRGVSGDFSLTPKEFEIDASLKFDRITLILDEITSIYEVSRFSESEITDKMLNRMEYLIGLIKIEFEIK